MAKKNYEWDGKLQPNRLTRDVENDYIFVPNHKNKTYRNADVAQDIKNTGSEFQYETILNIIDRADSVRRQKLQEGYSVITGICHVQPSVQGTWTGAQARFDPALHKVTCTFSPSSELRTALTDVAVVPTGVKDSGAYIGLVTDAATGAIDGTITAGDDIVIEGDKIKVAPEGEEGLGVFFVADDGTETPVTRRFTENNPKKLIARVPELGAGTYRLVIKTRFTRGSSDLTEARSIEYVTPLVVM